jgi:hypothetical protein
MLKKILFFAILLIIFNDIYYLYYHKSDKKEEKIEIIKNKSIKISEPIYDKRYSVIEKPIDKIMLAAPIEEIDSVMPSDNELDEYIDPKMFGEPTDYSKNKYIYWDFSDPHPWTKIMYKYGDEYPFYFFIRIKIPSLNDYENWKELIINLDFDAQKGEMIIPAKDEETALSIANLIISNFKGSVSINDIVKKDLLQVSIEKCKKYSQVKAKIISQIMDSPVLSSNSKLLPDYNANSKTKEKFTNIKHNKVISDAEPSIDSFTPISDNFTPYEGGEFSFL